MASNSDETRPVTSSSHNKDKRLCIASYVTAVSVEFIPGNAILLMVCGRTELAIC